MLTATLHWPEGQTNRAIFHSLAGWVTIPTMDPINGDALCRVIIDSWRHKGPVTFVLTSLDFVLYAHRVGDQVRLTRIGLTYDATETLEVSVESFFATLELLVNNDLDSSERIEELFSKVNPIIERWNILPVI